MILEAHGPRACRALQDPVSAKFDQAENLEAYVTRAC